MYQQVCQEEEEEEEKEEEEEEQEEEQEEQEEEEQERGEIATCFTCDVNVSAAKCVVQRLIKRHPVPSKREFDQRASYDVPMASLDQEIDHRLVHRKLKTHAKEACYTG
jgi:hypothetical protein